MTTALAASREPLLVSRARTADLAEVSELLLRAVPDCIPQTVEQLWERRDQIWVARRDDGGPILASAALVEMDDGRYELRSVIVEPGVRGSGVGQELVVEAVRQCHIRAENPCPRRFGRRRSAPSEVPKRRERQAMILDICIRAVQRGAVLFEPLRCTTLRHGPRQAGLGCLFVRNRDVGRGVLIDDAGGVHRAYAKIVIHAERYLSTSNAAVPSGRCAGKPTTTDSCRHGYCAGLLARSDEVARAIRDHLPHIKQTPRHR